jgi:hypothetical protein
MMKQDNNKIYYTSIKVSKENKLKTNTSQLTYYILKDSEVRK